MTLAYQLLRSDNVLPTDEEQLAGHVQWIESHLPIPRRFARKKNVSHKHTHGISWLKPHATEVMAHMYAVADIAGKYGYHVQILRTDRPGYIVHEDDWQVVAEPFHGEGN